MALVFLVQADTTCVLHVSLERTLLPGSVVSSLLLPTTIPVKTSLLLPFSLATPAPPLQHPFGDRDKTRERPSTRLLENTEGSRSTAHPEHPPETTHSPTTTTTTTTTPRTHRLEHKPNSFSTIRAKTREHEPPTTKSTVRLLPCSLVHKT